MEGKYSPSLQTPLQMLRPVEDEEPLHKRRMAIVAHTTTISPFKLPDDWVVEERTRTSGNSAGIIDRYYYEPGTGRQFRSLRAVEKYLMEAEEYTPTPKPSKPGNHITMLRWDEKEEVHHKREMAIVAPTATSTPTTTSCFKLPDDWVVRKIPRRSGYSAGRIDKYYYEPSTGRLFRSLKAVVKYLTEEKENTPTTKALKPGNPIMPSQNSGSWKKNIYRLKAKTSSSNFANPPVKIKWVLSGPGGDTWSPFMGDSMVPDSLKQQWAETFVLSVNYRDFNAPSSKGDD